MSSSLSSPSTIMEESGQSVSSTPISKHSHSSHTPLQKSDKKIGVGKEYQANLDLYVHGQLNGKEHPDADECLWHPNYDIPDTAIVDYCKQAIESHNITSDRALLILMKCNYNINMAKKKLRERHFYGEQFSLEDSFLFRNAFNCYGKKFHKIRHVMPKKSTSALVEHYYKTKKKQHYKSFYDADLFADVNSDDEKSKEKDVKTGYNGSCGFSICENCNNLVTSVFPVNGLNVCRTCQLYFRAMNLHRSCDKDENCLENIRSCPPEVKEMVDEFDELMQPEEHGNENVCFENADDSGEIEIERPRLTKCQVQIREVESEIEKTRAKTSQFDNFLKQEHASLVSSNDVIKRARAFISSTRPSNNQKTPFSYQWSDREKLAALHALVRFNCDFHVVSDILGTKSSDQVKAFHSKHVDAIQQKINEVKGNLASSSKTAGLGNAV